VKHSATETLVIISQPGVAWQKTWIFINTTVRTTNHTNSETLSCVYRYTMKGTAIITVFALLTHIQPTFHVWVSGLHQIDCIFCWKWPGLRTLAELTYVLWYVQIRLLCSKSVKEKNAAQKAFVGEEQRVFVCMCMYVCFLCPLEVLVHPQQWDVFWLPFPFLIDGFQESEAQSGPSEHENFSVALQ
jgi:hypothetical protein